jgi:hypothetical protein
LERELYTKAKQKEKRIVYSKLKGKGFWNSKMDQNTLVNLRMGKWMEKENIFGPAIDIGMKDSIKIILEMVLEHITTINKILRKEFGKAVIS